MACSPAMTPAANLRLEHPPHEEHDRLAWAADDALRAGQYERARELYAAAAELVTQRLLALTSRRRELRELVGAELPRLLAFATLACGLQVAASDVVADMLAELDDEAILSAPRPGRSSSRASSSTSSRSSAGRPRWTSRSSRTRCARESRSPST